MDLPAPPGSSIDASQVDAWQFSVGTQIWKEFSFGARAEKCPEVRLVSTRRGRFALNVACDLELVERQTA